MNLACPNPNCGKRYNVPDDRPIPKSLACPACKTPFLLTPAPDPEPQSPAPFPSAQPYVVPVRSSEPQGVYKFVLQALGSILVSAVLGVSYYIYYFPTGTSTSFPKTKEEYDSLPQKKKAQILAAHGLYEQTCSMCGKKTVGDATPTGSNNGVLCKNCAPHYAWVCYKCGQMSISFTKYEAGMPLICPQCVSSVDRKQLELSAQKPIQFDAYFESDKPLMHKTDLCPAISRGDMCIPTNKFTVYLPEEKKTALDDRKCARCFVK